MEHFRRRVSGEETSGRLERALSGWAAARRPSPAREDSSEDAITGENFKGSLGLNLLRDVTEPVIDFIFVHGLGGGSRKTWSKSHNPYHYWPKEWLSQDPEFSCVRVHSFGYKADWNERKESVLDIHDFALSLLGEIDNIPEIRRSKTKIVFIAHSMGGLVVKKAYILARENPSLNQLAKRIHTLYFLATPHRGSDLAKTLINIMKVSFGQKTFVSELDRNSESISSTNDSFRHYAEDLQLWSFYETLPSSLVLTSAIIVDKVSATLGYAKERVSLLNADHRGVCKFSLPSDPNYKILRNAFITTVDTILSEISQITSETSKFQNSRLVELIGVTEPPTNDLVALEDIRVHGSGQWLTSKQIYISWRTPWSDSPPILWLTGNAGAGKSVLCSQLINDLQEQNLRCSYFFFKHGNLMESNMAGCLRSLAYQMAKSDEAVLQKVLGIEQNAGTCTQWDERTIWRKLFNGCIFQVSKPLPQFWVIDALDECQNFPSFLSLVAKAPAYLRIFFTSRRTLEAEQSLTSLGPLVEGYQLQSEDILGDLATFIESKMDRLAVYDDDGRANLKEKLLVKSSGSFLWTSLIIPELEHAFSEEGIEEALNDVPEDMNKLYTRMLKSIPTNERAVRLSKSVLTWTLLAMRSLTVDEMQSAIKIGTNQTVHNLRRSVSAICGQLVDVDRNNRVRSIHETAQAFLLRQDVVNELALNRSQSHTRMAKACLEVFGGDSPQGNHFQGVNTGISALNLANKLTDYACIFFSDHLQRSSSGDSTTWKDLCGFLESNVLVWIEYLAREGKLYHVTRTAKNLRTYLTRRLKHMNPLSRGKELLESWINDMIKLSAKFRTSLSLSPSSIHTLIPALCPSDSAIAQRSALGHRVFSMEGLVHQSWDECLAIIDYPAKQTSSIALGDRYLVVAISDGTIFVYYRDSFQLRTSYDHGERPKILLLSSECSYLASSSPRKVKVWNTETNTQMWAFDTADQVLTIFFLRDDTALLAATQGNYTSLWDLQEGLLCDSWRWNESIPESTDLLRPSRPPGKALISPDGMIMAVCYRGLPIYLWHAEARTFVGCCSRSKDGNQYFVDALAFNPCREINMLVASYGDGELGVFDLSSTKLRHRYADVFAQTLACSPDGRTLVTGSSRGVLQVFEFGGIGGETLSLIHRVDADDDGIKSIAFSSDSLGFADIRESRCRVWEPAVLVRSDVEGGSQSEMSSATTLVPKSVGMLERPQEADITALCYDGSGEFVFCGKLDGKVVYFETRNAIEKGFLYHHAANIRITCVAYDRRSNFLITADESGRVIITKLTTSKDMCKTSGEPSEIRLGESITSLLPNVMGTRLLIQGMKHATVWTMGGEKVGPSIHLVDEKNVSGIGNTTIVAHPLQNENFIVISRIGMRSYSWANSLPEESLTHEHFSTPSIDIAPPSPEQPKNIQFEKLLQRRPTKRQVNFVASFTKASLSSAVLRIWLVSSVGDRGYSLQSEPLFDPDKIALKVKEVIAIDGNRFLFLDKDLWVCSLELEPPALDGHSVQRHFFLLSEWQNGGKDFIVQYSSSKREFAIASKDHLLVAKRGLDFAEPWLAS